jgi:hypothetical protein
MFMLGSYTSKPPLRSSEPLLTFRQLVISMEAGGMYLPGHPRGAIEPLGVQ